MSEIADNPPTEEGAEVRGGEVRDGVNWLVVWVVMGSLAAVVSTGLVWGAGGTRGFYLPALAVVVCGVAAFWDGSTGRIPNTLTYGAILVGLGLNSVVPLLERMGAGVMATWLGSVGPGASWAGFGVCLLMVLVGPLVKGVHGGDLKLLAGLGAMLGLVQTANALLPGLVVAVLYSVVNLAVRGRLNGVVRVGSMKVMELLYLGRTGEAEGDRMGASQVPMAVPLAVGLVVGQVWQWRVGGGG